MKLSELRDNLKTAGAFDSWALSAISAQELVADTDQAIENAKHIGYADGYSKALEQRGYTGSRVPLAFCGEPYRQAVRTGWNGAINAMRARFPANGHVLDEMLSGHVLDMNPGERKMAEAKSDQYMKAINGQLERIQYLEKQEKHTLAVFEEQRGMIRGLASTLDQVRALETHETTVLMLDKRVSVLEQRDISPAAEASIAKYQDLGKRIAALENGWQEHQRLYEGCKQCIGELETNVTGHDLRVEGLENWQSKVRGT